MTNRNVLICAVVSTLLLACTPAAETPDRVVTQPFRKLVGSFEELETPSAPGAGQPHVAIDSSGEFLLSWTEPDGEQYAVKMARLSDGVWTEPSVIASRSDFFVNWADFPSILSSGDAIYAHWLQRSAPGTYNYDVMVSISVDGGATWGDPFVLHDDGAKAEHGFVSFVGLPDSRAGVVWLDGREMAGGHDDGHGEMGLRYATLSPDGAISDEVLLDGRTCECCTTTLTSTPDGPLVAWRDRSDTEVRDIWVARQQDGVWSDPALLHEDGWTIDGCPVNGPQSDSIGDRTVVAWFTGAEGEGDVKVAFSSDRGKTFEAPLTLAIGELVVGYVDVVLVAADRALVVWMEDKEDRLDLMSREVAVGGMLGDVTTVASTSRGRTGFARMARSGDEVLLAWNEKGDSPRLHVARARFSR